MRLKYKFTHDIDAPERTSEHAQIIATKPFLNNLYKSWYQTLFTEVDFLDQKRIVELGSGGGFLKDLVPTVITSDFLDLPQNDLCFSALEMPFEDLSLDAIFMIDTFHHLPDANLFLHESMRVLKPGGKIIMIEPANSSWGRFIYQRFHHEPFDPRAGWSIPLAGPLSGANGAMPWIVFERDKKLFQERFPAFNINKIQYHTPFLYLFSGGVSFRQLVPSFSYGLFKLIDQVASTISPHISMFMTIVVTKK